MVEEKTQALLTLIRDNLTKSRKLKKLLSHYHESDIADAVELLNAEERQTLYNTLGPKEVSEFFPYLENVEDYVEELGEDKSADIIEEMDADDALDVLQELEEEDRKVIAEKMENESLEDVRLLASYEEDEIGAMMTTNFIVIPKTSTIKQAMRLVVKEAAENDNVNTIYVVDEEDKFYGTIELKDLIIARSDSDIENIIHTNFPNLYGHDLIQDKINDLKEWSLDMVPVLDEGNILIGVITSSDVIEAVDEALGEDYAKFAGLSDEEDINEPYFKSLKKRLPWLFLLLALGLCVSLVISQFEAIIAIIPMVAFFQSIVLDMAGNIGTQSLAVTIRFLSDEDVTAKKIWKMIIKEVKLGVTNGFILGASAFLVVFLFLYISHQPITGDIFLIQDAIYLASAVLVAIVIALSLASFVAVVIPCFLKKLKIDPAVASGPLITTIDDLVAVISYFGISMAFFAAIL